MVMALWCADLLDKRFKNKLITGAELTREVIIVLSCVLFVAWLGGYFFSGGPLLTALPYGTGSMNLLAPINSASWSFILKTLPNTQNSYEDFDYLGLGVILGFIFTLPILVSEKSYLYRIFQQKLFLVLLIIGLTAFAISNQITIGPWTITYPLPNLISLIGSILRQSARFFWPVVYIISFLIIYIIVRSYSHRTAVILISFILIVQIIDTSAGWLPIKEKIAKANQQSDIFSQHRAFFSDPFWANAAAHYHQLLIVPPQQPPGQIPYNWERYASFAMAHGMSTNSVYLARIDNQRLAAFNQNFEIAIAQGKYNSAAIYIVGDEMILPILMHLDSSTDLLARVNGLNVLAPGWKVCPSCPQVPPAFEIRQVIPTTDKKEKLDFSTSGLAKHFLVGVGAWPIVGWGWSYPEAFGTWSEGYQVKLTIPLPKEPILGITLEMRALVSPNHPQQIAAIWVNGQFQKKVALTQGNGNQVAIPIAPTTPARDYVKIEFSLESRAKPKDLGLGDDIRELAIGLTRGWWW